MRILLALYASVRAVPEGAECGLDKYKLLMMEVQTDTHARAHTHTRVPRARHMTPTTYEIAGLTDRGYVCTYIHATI